ncbi:polysaccharide deacetylase family protein [Parvularcula sp. IMCC14364]|uniref:polysaccharide deacetylase family protein n=1 Tax=Parvularcula sp. IMCC14364 TaxID=3067902 RepID=UPI0027421687|nr:polysaccharide deacetylase family protein [Parvularcula sp. IMCC14364]
MLLYHAIGEGPDACLEERFAEQMAWLATHAKVVSLEDLLSVEDSEYLQIAITFDDGYASVAQVAAPIMARHGFSGTVYLTVSCIEDSEELRRVSDPASGHLSGEQFMTWAEVRALESAGWLIGSHGLDHVDMTTRTPSELRRQLENARERIEDRLGSECRAFAYPWGRNDATSRTAVMTAGYAHGAGTLHGPLRYGSSLIAFPRIDIRREYRLDDFVCMLRGDWDFLGTVQNLKALRHASAFKHVGLI